jgi:[ribosomal protein S18]-alanine N-acetyltransferase
MPKRTTAVTTQANTEALFVPMTVADLDAVMEIEQRVYTHPWSRSSFADVLESGYAVHLLKAGDALLGYFVVMQGVEEAHLLNIALAPEYQRQGWAPLMLEAVEIWARARSAVWLWLEVRSGNTRAQAVYRTRGYEPVGRRNGYYAAGRCQREDAVVMRLAL